MVEHSVRDAGAAGSSPVIPIFQFLGLAPVTRMGGRPLNEPSSLSLPLAPKNGLVNPLFFTLFCLSLSPISPLPYLRFSFTGAYACHPHGWSPPSFAIYLIDDRSLRLLGSPLRLDVRSSQGIRDSLGRNSIYLHFRPSSLLL